MKVNLQIKGYDLTMAIKYDFANRADSFDFNVTEVAERYHLTTEFVLRYSIVLFTYPAAQYSLQS